MINTIRPLQFSSRYKTMHTSRIASFHILFNSKTLAVFVKVDTKTDLNILCKIPGEGGATLGVRQE